MLEFNLSQKCEQYALFYFIVGQAEVYLRCAIIWSQVPRWESGVGLHRIQRARPLGRNGERAGGVGDDNDAGESHCRG